ncbi:MAG: polysulfide reductase NrfD, partial [Candidatus Omnitrophica bacterium]|nr:polysulfide reductase NrfD [Candidatus Omnitrophota bacterium]
LHQEWRNSISRFAEATTLFAVACAGLFPLFHLGRVWRFYYILPYPNSMDLWPQWRSPLVWDVFAVMTYGTVSLLFWYVGLVPDLATMRDRAKSRFPRICFGILSLGWRNSARHWNSYQTAYLLLAGLATPLVVSVHSIVSLDFTVSIIPGWHSTIFPPYFVAGAIYSGFAMLLTLLIPLRAIYGLKGLITDRHLENMGKVLLVTGLLVGYGYVMEGFTTWYSDNEYEWYMTVNRYTGPYAVVVWSLMVCNVLAVQALWLKWCRRNVYVLFIVAMAVNVGMWIERYMIVVTSLHRDFLPSSWGMYAGTFWDWTLLFGSIGLFLTLTFVFVRLLPMISIFEMRELIAHKQDDSSSQSESEGATS